MLISNKYMTMSLSQVEWWIVTSMWNYDEKKGFLFAMLFLLAHDQHTLHLTLIIARLFQLSKVLYSAWIK